MKEKGVAGKVGGRVALCRLEQYNGRGVSKSIEAYHWTWTENTSEITNSIFATRES